MLYTSEMKKTRREYFLYSQRSGTGTLKAGWLEGTAQNLNQNGFSVRFFVRGASWERRAYGNGGNKLLIF